MMYVVTKIIDLDFTLKIIFSRLRDICCAIIVIDRNPMEVEAIEKVVDVDSYCWNCDKQGKPHKIAWHVLLCIFHAKKAWVDFFLPHVSLCPHLFCLSVVMLGIRLFLLHSCRVSKDKQGYIYVLSHLM